MNAFPKLLVQDLNFSISGQKIFSNIQFQLERGEIVSLLGPSGCGKSSLLKAICGVVQTQSGKIHFDPESKNDFAALSPQTGLLLPWLTIEENIRFFIEKGKPESRQEQKEEISEALRSTGLAQIQKKYPAEISVGMAQRVSILRAFLSHASLIVLDEPFNGLDFQTRDKTISFLLTLWKSFRPTILLVTHNLEEAVWLSHKVLLMGPDPRGIFKEIRIKDLREDVDLEPSFRRRNDIETITRIIQEETAP